MVGSTFYLHIGPPKTATTFLQEEVLSKVQSVDHAVKPEVRAGAEIVRFGNLFLRSPQVWKEVGPDLFENLHSGETNDLLIKVCLASPNPWVPAWIGEAVQQYGPVVRVYRQTSGLPIPSFVSIHLEELSKVASDCGFSETKVLLTVRRQDTKLASSYAQLSNRVRGASQKHFEDWVRHLVRESSGYYMAGGVKLDYLLWWEKVVDAVGQEQVLVLPFELLRENPTAFLSQWLAFLDVPEPDRVIQEVTRSEGQMRNARSKASYRWAIRDPMQLGPDLGLRAIVQALGISTNYSLQWLDFFRDDEIVLVPEFRDEILDAYRVSNRELDTSLPHLDLERYGYY